MGHQKFKILAAIVVFCVAFPIRAIELMGPGEFQNEALRSNLDLRLKESDLEEAKANSTGIRIPSIQVGLSQMEMNGGGQARGWQVSQPIPFPTKIYSHYNARGHALQAEKELRNAKAQETLVTAKYLYFLVWESQEQESILNEKAKLLREHLLVARSVSRSDTFAKMHLLKVESELDQIKNDLEVLSETQKERMTLAAQFLDKDPGTFHFKAQDPGLSDMPRIQEIKEVPLIKAAKNQLNQMKSMETLGKSEWLPNFNLTYSHMEQTARFPENNQITLGISLPFVYFWQPRSDSDKAFAKRQAAEINLQKTTRSVEANLANLKSTMQSLKNQIDTVSGSILPRSLKRKRLVQNTAPRDLSSLQEHLDAFLTIPNLHLQILRLKSKYEQAVAAYSRFQDFKDGSDG